MSATTGHEDEDAWAVDSSRLRPDCARLLSAVGLWAWPAGAVTWMDGGVLLRKKILKNYIC